MRKLHLLTNDPLEYDPTIFGEFEYRSTVYKENRGLSLPIDVLQISTDKNMNSLLNYYSLTNKTHDTYLNYLTGFIKLYKLVSDSLEHIDDQITVITEFIRDQETVLDMDINIMAKYMLSHINNIGITSIIFAWHFYKLSKIKIDILSGIYYASTVSVCQEKWFSNHTINTNNINESINSIISMVAGTNQLDNIKLYAKIAAGLTYYDIMSGLKLLTSLSYLYVVNEITNVKNLIQRDDDIPAVIIDPIILSRYPDLTADRLDNETGPDEEYISDYDFPAALYYLSNIYGCVYNAIDGGVRLNKPNIICNEVPDNLRNIKNEVMLKDVMATIIYYQTLTI